MVRVSSKRGHKLQTKWKGSMRVTKTKSRLLFDVEIIDHQHKVIAHTERLSSYHLTAIHNHVFEELYQQASYYRTMTQIVEGPDGRGGGTAEGGGRKREKKAVNTKYWSNGLDGSKLMKLEILLR